MKRLLVFLLALLLLIGALAEEAFYIDCDCGKAPCVCFLQEGDTGPVVGKAIALLKEKEYLPAKHARYVFDEAVTRAISAFQADNGLARSGLLDDVTLTLLIRDDIKWEERKFLVVWVPVNGGRKYHEKADCSEMKNPRKISLTNALALGIQPCRRCYRGIAE